MTSQGSQRSPTGIWVAIAVAALFLLVGIVPLLLTSEEQPAADTPVATTLDQTTPTTGVAPTTTVTEPSSTTEAFPQAAEPKGVFGFPPDIPIKDKTGFDITNTLVHIDEYISAIGTGTPEALFDTGSLGVEEVLTIAEVFDTEGGSTPSPSSQRATQQLTLWAVRLEGTDAVAQFGAFLEYPDASETPEYDANIEFGLNVSPGGGHGNDHLQQPEPLGLLMVADFGRGLATGVAGLPPEAAAVSTVYGDGTGVWQRPLFGMVLFNNTTRVCEPEPAEGQGCSPMELTVHDETGTPILRIVTPVSEPNGRYMIIMSGGDTYIRP